MHQDVNVKLRDSGGSLHYACSRDKTFDDVVILLNSVLEDPGATNNEGKTFLMKSVMSGLVDRCKIFLEQDIDVNQQTVLGTTALHYAASAGLSTCAKKHKMISLLLNHGANPNIRKCNGDTPLHLVLSGQILKNTTTCVTLLLQHGASVNVVRLKNNVTPLMLASENGHVESLRLLLKHNANVNEADSKGKTALHRAGVNVRARDLRYLVKLDPFQIKKRHDIASLLIIEGEAKIDNTQIIRFAKIIRKRDLLWLLKVAFVKRVPLSVTKIIHHFF